jgi:hypothetical protein
MGTIRERILAARLHAARVDLRPLPFLETLCKKPEILFEMRQGYVKPEQQVGHFAPTKFKQVGMSEHMTEIQIGAQDITEV